MIIRAHVDWIKDRFFERVGNEYVYGGVWSPTDVHQGCDCSALVAHVLNGVLFGPEMTWGRVDPTNNNAWITTESWRPIDVGEIGPFGTITVASPADFPKDSIVKVALHHGPGGGENSHMWAECDGIRMESGGAGQVTGAAARSVYDTAYANDWAYLPSGGTPVEGEERVDSLFADVSEWQVPVDDSYPYKILSIRSNDGTHRDRNFAQNYAWMRKALDTEKLTMGIVYCYCRPDWVGTADTMRSMIESNGGLHPKVALMLDVESGGNPGGDGSDWVNRTYWRLADWIGKRDRIIGYGNVSDLNTLWRTKPQNIKLIVASYGSNPPYLNKIAHQYTDGQGYGGGLPEGTTPFGHCDMNSADGYSPEAFAQACGLGVAAPPPPPPVLTLPGDLTQYCDLVASQFGR